MYKAVYNSDILETAQEDKAWRKNWTKRNKREAKQKFEGLKQEERG